MNRPGVPVPSATGRNYIKVRAGKGKHDFGWLFDADPEDVIQVWREAGGVTTSTGFIPWHKIDEITFERDWKPPYYPPGQ